MTVDVVRTGQPSAGRADRPTVDSSDSLLSLLALSLAMSAIACGRVRSWLYMAGAVL